MASEIEVVEEVESRNVESSSSSTAVNGGGGTSVEEESLRNDVYTAAAYADMEKLQRFFIYPEMHICSANQFSALRCRIENTASPKKATLTSLL